MKLTHREVCLFMPQLSLALLCLHMEEWPGLVDLRGTGIVTYKDSILEQMTAVLTQICILHSDSHFHVPHKYCATTTNPLW